MNTEHPEIRHALEEDLNRLGINQIELAARMTNAGERSLSEQAVSNWKRDGRIPRGRVDKLLEVLGPGSHISVLLGSTSEPRDPNLQAYEGLVLAGRTTDGYSPSNPYSKPTPGFEVRPPLKAYAGQGLSEQYRRYVETAIEIGRIRIGYDYMSPTVVAECVLIDTKTLASTPAGLYRKMFRLAMAKKLDGDRPRYYGLIAIGNTSDKTSGALERCRTEANVMGIDFQVAATPEAASKQIELWEIVGDFDDMSEADD